MRVSPLKGFGSIVFVKQPRLLSGSNSSAGQFSVTTLTVTTNSPVGAGVGPVPGRVVEGEHGRHVPYQLPRGHRRRPARGTERERGRGGHTTSQGCGYASLRGGGGGNRHPQTPSKQSFKFPYPLLYVTPSMIWPLGLWPRRVWGACAPRR